MSTEAEPYRYQHHFTVVGTLDENGMPIFWVEENLNIEGSVYDTKENWWINPERQKAVDDRLYFLLRDTLMEKNVQ